MTWIVVVVGGSGFIAGFFFGALFMERELTACLRAASEEADTETN